MEKIQTKDGSFTIKHPEIKELYHSIHGALQESQHVFIEQGLALHTAKKEVYIFEMGLGTGLNTLMTYRFAKKNNLSIFYYAIETHPIAVADTNTFSYTKNEDEQQFFNKLHHVSWNTLHVLDPHFSIYKIKGKIEEEDLSFIKNKIDVVYFDAFAPSAQEHLWQEPVLSKMYALLKENGHLTTYCAQGQFKRDLKQIGYTVKAVPGPPGKREMTLGFKKFFNK